MVNQLSLTHPYPHLRDAMHQLLEDSVVPAGTRNGTNSPVRSLPLDVYATPDEVVILAAVPGMNPRDLENQNTLTLAGTMPSAGNSEEGKRGTWYLSELWHGTFRRSLTLPFEVEDGKAEATFEHGIVRIVLPKAERVKPQKIAIRVADTPAPPSRLRRTGGLSQAGLNPRGPADSGVHRARRSIFAWPGLGVRGAGCGKARSGERSVVRPAAANAVVPFGCLLSAVERGELGRHERAVTAARRLAPVLIASCRGGDQAR